MKTEVRAGAVIETATPEEVQHALRTGVADYFQELARGVSPWRFQSAPVTVAGGLVTVPGHNDNACGPNNGFCVAVQTVRIRGLAAGDVVKIFRNSINGEQVDEGVMAATGTLLVIREGSHGLFLNSGEELVFSGSGLTATGDVTVSVEGTECSSIDAYKVLLG